MDDRKTSNAGFTLVELLVAIVVAGILSAGMVQLFMVQNQAYVRQNAGVLASQNARAGFDMLVRELRNAGHDPRGSAGAGITRWSPDTVGWTADLNADGDVLDGEETVMFYYDADTRALVRQEGMVAAPVADGITAMEFDYFQDAWGLPATTAGDIRQIRVTMEFETPQGVMDGRIQTQVAIRNNIY